MAIRPDCILRPSNPVSRDFVPAQGTPYRVKDNDSWQTVAQKNGIDEWQLVRFNYPNLPADKQSAARQVNWYLQEYVGCRLLTADRKNYRFSVSAISDLRLLAIQSSSKRLRSDFISRASTRR